MLDFVKGNLVIYNLHYTTPHYSRRQNTKEEKKNQPKPPKPPVFRDGPTGATCMIPIMGNEDIDPTPTKTGGCGNAVKNLFNR